MNLRHVDGCVLTCRFPVDRSRDGTGDPGSGGGNDEDPERGVRDPFCRIGRRGGRALGRGTGGECEAEGLQSEPDPLRSRHRGLGSAVRVAEHALHEQRLLGGLARRGRLQLDARGGGQERSRPSDRRRDSGAQTADGQVQGRRGGALARNLGDVRLPHERSHGRAAARERRTLHQRRWSEPESRRADARRLGRQGHPRPAYGRRAERHDPESDTRSDLHVGRVVRRLLQVPDRPQAGQRHCPADRGDTGRGEGAQFPQNTGLLGGTVQVWPVNMDGRRTAAAPLHSIAISDGSTGGGAWGPVTVQSVQRYEFALVRPGLPTLHVYYEPFVRSDYTLRLLASPAIEAYAGNRPGSMSAVNIRYKELWGDQGAENDQLLIDGVNICTPVLCPISKQVNAFFAFDRNRDSRTDLSSPDPVLGNLPFIQGADVYTPASSAHDGTASWQLI